MASLVLTGDTSGQVTIAAPAVAGTNTLTLQAATATNAVNTLATAVASTSGTSIDFTGLPSWIKRITVMFNGVSTSATSNLQIQIGSGSFTATGYVAQASAVGGGTGTVSSTTGFILTQSTAATDATSGNIQINLQTTNTYVSSGIVNKGGASAVCISAGVLALSGALDRVRITTVNGTDTFDAGSVNILYEG